jgi:hypothetical protein
LACKPVVTANADRHSLVTARSPATWVTTGSFRTSPVTASPVTVVVNIACALATGNRCGHDPQCPRWFEPPARHRERPGILRKLIDKARAYYTDPASTLPSLNLANGSERQQRSERREACLAVLSVLIHYLDLVTLRVGVPQGRETFCGLTMERVAALADIGLRRAERAIADLVAAGLVGVHPIAIETAPGQFVGRAAIRTVSPALFAAFGLGRWLRHERDKASARRRKQEKKAHVAGLAKIALTVRGAVSKGHRPHAETRRAGKEQDPRAQASDGTVPRPSH